mgnify:CR=1 FL=1
MKTLIVSTVLAFITFSAQAAAFQVTSNEIKIGEQLTTSHVFSGFGFEGGNTSPYNLVSCHEVPSSISITVL